MISYTTSGSAASKERACRLYSTVMTIAVTLLFVVSGCGRPINRTAERRIRDALPGYIGPARVWRAHVDNPAEETLRGRLARVTIDGEGVALKSAIPLDSLHIEMTGVEVDRGRNRLKSVQSTMFRAVVGDAGLNAYIRQYPPPEEEPVRVKRVEIRPGALYAEGTRWLLGRAWPFTTTAEPRLESETRLRFDPERMSVIGLRVPLPASALKWLANRLSQGFDFSTLPFPVRIHRFTAESGRVIIEGDADVLPSLNERLATESLAVGCENYSGSETALPGD